ncbi:MAG: hypothetical protein JXR60_10800 [Bacteroidales bacterium]|nr:hypothetical protein [Bacteroidales bacterium]
MRIFKKSQVDFEKDKDQSAGNKWIGAVKDFVDVQKINRETIGKQLPFVLFLAFLGIVYISNQFHAEKLVNEVNEMKKLRNEKRAEYISSASELMKITRQSEVEKIIAQEGLKLKPLTIPPHKIIIENE